MPTASTLMFIRLAMGRVMGRLRATAAELLIMLDRKDPNMPMP